MKPILKVIKVEGSKTAAHHNLTITIELLQNKALVIHTSSLQPRKADLENHIIQGVNVACPMPPICDTAPSVMRQRPVRGRVEVGGKRKIMVIAAVVVPVNVRRSNSSLFEECIGKSVEGSAQGTRTSKLFVGLISIMVMTRVQQGHFTIRTGKTLSKGEQLQEDGPSG
ncbi:unnamed protein product [Cercopithifilaria johnstoni]|uniref:Uncharacterized protein n=1 Tax=Cercopithifilaria johnstoni TaxID=2874296 RepID=A0A8J2LYM1_9BILA|nr:unnamed protein product [Cercopithifilaria johnstoni]